MEPTIVTFLQDRTGSMLKLKAATIEAFNGYLAGLRPEKGAKDTAPIAFTFLQFDSVSLDKVCVAEPIENVPELNEQTFQPRATTPLIDACVKTIRAVAKSLLARNDKPKVVVCIQTDGLENASTEHTWDELNRLIKEKTAAGWQFNFLGVGIDSYQQAQQMGISMERTIAAAPEESSIRNAYHASASNTRAFSSGLISDTKYTHAQRRSSGDEHYLKHFQPIAQVTVPTVPPATPADKSSVDLTAPTAPVRKQHERKESLVEEPEL